MKEMILTFEDFEKWKTETRILYASCSITNRKMYCHLNGTIDVEKDGQVIWRGMQPFTAIEEFNNA